MNATWWRPLLTVALFSVLPFAVFVNDNRAYLEPGAILGPFVIALFAVGLVTVVAADRLRGPLARERAAVVFAAVAFVLFQFRFARSIAELVSDADLAALLVWLALLAIAVATRDPGLQARPRMELRGGGGGPAPRPSGGAVRVVQADDRGARGSGGSGLVRSSRARPSRPTSTTSCSTATAARTSSSVRSGSTTNRSSASSERRGFEVGEEATAAYPVTFLSVASTLAMGYPAEPGELDDYVSFFESVGGDNEAVEAFKGLGYQFAFASDYSSFECGEAVDVCIEPSREGIEGFDGEKEAAILGATPFATLLPALGMHFSSLDGYVTPDLVVEQVAEARSDDPLFAYFHVLSPHPPYRYVEGCELREDLTTPGLDDWGVGTETGGEEYARAARCVNRSLLRAIDSIEASDPNAIIVLQGDHGPKFGMEFHRPLSDWTREQLDLRYSILNAQRLPPGCGLEAAGAQSSVQHLPHDPRLHHRRGGPAPASARADDRLGSRRNRAGGAAGRVGGAVQSTYPGVTPECRPP